MKKRTRKKLAARNQATEKTVLGQTIKAEHNHAPAHRAQKHLIHTEAKRKSAVR